MNSAIFEQRKRLAGTVLMINCIDCSQFRNSFEVVTLHHIDLLRHGSSEFTQKIDKQCIFEWSFCVKFFLLKSSIRVTARKPCLLPFVHLKLQYLTMKSMIMFEVRTSNYSETQTLFIFNIPCQCFNFQYNAWSSEPLQQQAKHPADIFLQQVQLIVKFGFLDPKILSEPISPESIDLIQMLCFYVKVCRAKVSFY